jgi:hypothetical protein
MKLSTSILALAVIIPVTSFASVSEANNIVLKPINDKVETQACYVAATQGIKAAKSFLQAEDYSFSVFNTAVTCNGIRITDFADKYTVKSNDGSEAVEKQLSKVKLVAMDNKESQLCVDAVLLGEREARLKNDAINEVVYCNSQTLGRFARSYRNKNVTL